MMGTRNSPLETQVLKTADVNTCSGQTLAAFERYMERAEPAAAAMWLPPLRRGVVCGTELSVCANGRGSCSGGREERDAGAARFG